MGYLCRFTLKSVGRQGAQLGVQPDAVIKANNVVGGIDDGLQVMGIVLLLNQLHLQI